MLRKVVWLPMIIAMIIYGVAYLIRIVVVVEQDWFMKVSHHLMHRSNSFEDVGFVVPFSVYTMPLVLIELAVFFMVMKRYKGNSRRLVGVIMIAVWVLLPYVWMPFSFMYLRGMYVAEIAKISGLDALLSFLSPVTSVAGILVVIAIGRYGIIVPPQDEVAEE
ncbi:MAG: hypothetical protein J6T67_11340 [Paludibacteraceae bacterium]|nr:hypothetical protein [Paludibacteraceae bacterium]